MQVKRVFVVGAGLMGSGIAQVCAQAGMLVCIYDVNQDSVKKALKNIAWSTGKLIEKKKISGSLDEVMGRIEPVDQLSKITGVDTKLRSNAAPAKKKHRLADYLLGVTALSSTRTYSTVFRGIPS